MAQSLDKTCDTIAKKFWDLYTKQGVRDIRAEINGDIFTTDREINIFIHAAIDLGILGVFEYRRYKEDSFVVIDYNIVDDPDVLGDGRVLRTYLRPNPVSFSYGSKSQFCLLRSLVIYLHSKGIDVSELLILTRIMSCDIWNAACEMFRSKKSVEEIFEFLTAGAVALRLSKS